MANSNAINFNWLLYISIKPPCRPKSIFKYFV